MPRPATARRALRPIRFALVLGASLLAGLALFGLHRVQVDRNADSLLERGREAVAANDFAAATKLFKNYRNFRPNDPEGLRAYADALEKANPDRTPAEELAATYLRLDSLDALEPAGRERLAKLYLMLGNPVRARENAERLLREDPGNTGLTEVVAESRELEGDFPGAVSDYRRAVETGKASPAAYVRLADLLRTRVKTPEADAEATQVLEKLVADAPNDPRRLVARAKARARVGDQVGAYADALAAVKTPGEPDSDAALTLASLSTEPGQLPLARDALEKAIAAADSTRLRLALADIEARAGDATGARATLRKAAEAYQKLDITLLSIGDRLVGFGDVDAAAGVVARFAASPDTAAPADYLAGRVALAKGDWPAAVQLLEKSVALEGFARFPALRSRALVTLAEACAGSGDAARRRSALAEARRLDPSNVAAGVAWAGLIAREKPDEAAALLAAAQGDPNARAALVELRTSQQLARPEDRRDWNLVKLAAGDSPRPPRVEVAYASALLAQGKSAEARALLEAAAKRPEAARQAGVRVALALAQSATDLKQARATLAELERDSGDSAELRLARLALLTRDAKPDAKAAGKLADNLDQLPPADRARVAGSVAQVVLAFGDKAEALALLRRAAAAAPADWSSRLAALDLAAATGDESAKAQLLGELRKFDAPIPAVAEATAVLRDLKPGDTRIAALQEKLASARPGFGPAHVASGELARLAGQDDAAISHYRRAVEAGERSDGVLRNFAALLIRNGSRREAIEVLAKIGRTRGLPPDLAKQLTLLLATSGNAGAAGLTWANANQDAADWRDQIGRAAVYQSAGKPAQAREAAKKAVAIAGDRPEPWLALVQLLAADGPRRDVLDAVDAAQKKLPMTGEPRMAATNALARGALNRIAGRAAEAEAAYRAAQKALAGDVEVTAQLAAFLRDSGRAAEATAELKALTDSPRPEVARWARRNLALELVAGQPTPAKRNEALSLLDRNLGEGNLIDDRRAKALVIATDPTRLAEGIAALRATAADSPLSPEQNFYLGQMEAQAGNLEAAEAALSEAVRGESPATDHLAALARVQLRRGDPRAAGATAARLKQLAPAGWQTAATEARLLASAGKRDEAVATLTRGPFAKETALVGPLLEELGLPARHVYEQSVTDAPAGHARAAAYLIRTRQGTAAAELALAREATAPPALTAKLLAGAAHAGADAAAIERINKWLAAHAAQHAADPSFALLQAVLLDRAGKPAEALAAYERGLQSSPNDEALLNNAALLAALVDHDGGPRPMGWLATLFAARGATAATLDTRAVVHLAGGRADDAVRDLNAATGLNPSPVYYFHLAEARDTKPEDAAEVKARNAAIDEALRLGLKRDMLHATEWPTFERYKSVRGR